VPQNKQELAMVSSSIPTGSKGMAKTFVEIMCHSQIFSPNRMRTSNPLISSQMYTSHTNNPLSEVQDIAV
jgi:hypothetical protein